MNRCHFVPWVIAAAAFLVGCGSDPIEGTWENVNGACDDGRKDSFSIDGDLSGTGEFVLACTEDDEALVCPAHLFVKETPRDDMWTLEAQFGYCQATEQDYGRRFKECASAAEGEMTCCDGDGRNCAEYIRISD
ncbi:MAG: hypothetical protein JRI23_08170 [Deltaproteobacteria bacterium]|jgi:hypothetical protein|nr:hypothetical protein [Deltaproteobacteria bacterium]MBW2531588.1 hypothetical protein [Deltaproteobacteria bacterium]